MDTYIGQPLQAPTKLPPTRKGLSSHLVLIIIALLVAVLIGAGLMLANQDNSGPLSQRLSLRLDALESILKDGKKNASSDKLHKVTGETSLLLAGDMTAIEAVLPKTKAKVSTTAKAAEDVKPALERLKTAKINGAYDSAYTSELTAKVEATSALIKELYGETRSKSLKQALNTAHQHLAQTQKDLAAQ